MLMRMQKVEARLLTPVHHTSKFSRALAKAVPPPSTTTQYYFIHPHISNNPMVEVSLTVGKLDASLALLLTKDHHLIEFPTILLPNGVRAGSVVKISCERDLETEENERMQFLAVQEEILSTFGKNLPQTPFLKIKNVTQTSCVLEWDPLDLGTASLKSLTLFKDGKKLVAIPQPLSNRTTKLSGLPIEKSFKVQLKLDSTAGAYTSEIMEVTTHSMTDLSGIQVCLGDIAPNDQCTIDDIQQTLQNMGAHYPALDKMEVATTHFVTTRENKQNPEFVKASDMNIPIIRPEWLKACERERRIVGVRDFYVKECVLPNIFAKNYWQKPTPEALCDPGHMTGSQAQAPLDTDDIPSLAVSEPSSEIQDLKTPENTPIEDLQNGKMHANDSDGTVEKTVNDQMHPDLGAGNTQNPETEQPWVEKELPVPKEEDAKGDTGIPNDSPNEESAVPNTGDEDISLDLGPVPDEPDGTDFAAGAHSVNLSEISIVEGLLKENEPDTAGAHEAQADNEPKQNISSFEAQQRNGEESDKETERVNEKEEEMVPQPDEEKARTASLDEVSL